MRDGMSLCRRRHILTVLAGAAGLGVCRAARAEMAVRVLQSASSLTVAGPEVSEAGAWAMLLAPALRDSLGPAARLRLRFVGGHDGVTGANRFEARMPPDDPGALLFPGAASLAWLEGDSRVRFDASRMIAVMASVSPGVLLLRRRNSARRRQDAARIVGAGPLDPGVAGLLGLDLLGIPAVPAERGRNTLDALREGGADGVFLRGGNVPERARDLHTAGLVPFLAVGTSLDNGEPRRDAHFPNVPTWREKIAESGVAQPQLAAAWRALTAASTLDMAVSLPMVSAADSVAVWRRACDACMADPSVQADAAAKSLRLLSGTDASNALGAVTADMPTQLALRRWLAQRLDWRPT